MHHIPYQREIYQLGASSYYPVRFHIWPVESVFFTDEVASIFRLMISTWSYLQEA